VVKPRTTDRYGRTVARVECDGVDASAEQIRSGMAWVFDRYVSDSALYEMQAVARGERRGLWGDAEPVAPWEWRRAAR
jgi:endonuclease YncB( thermonuclease family)